MNVSLGADGGSPGLKYRGFPAVLYEIVPTLPEKAIAQLRLSSTVGKSQAL
jgi:hypothetical protein